MSELKLSDKDGGVALDILVQPRCPREGVGPIMGDRLKVSVNAPPVEGKANQAVQRVLAIPASGRQCTSRVSRSRQRRA
jgi:uncharacterized protein YggU (UPF0235/DUF167 family)